jgi:hypothetical protein
MVELGSPCIVLPFELADVGLTATEPVDKSFAFAARHGPH